MEQILARFWAALKHGVALIHPDSPTGALILLGLFALLGILLSKLLRHGLRLLLERDRAQRIDRLAATFLGKIGHIFIWVFMVMLYAHAIPELHKLGSALLASVSIASVVIGLAAQSTLANLVAGLSLIFYKPFRLGDRLEVTVPGGVETGVVEAVSLGYTILQTYDNRRVVLSNSTILNTVMINHTSGNPRVMAVVPFSIGFGADIDTARGIAMSLARDHVDVQEVVSCPVTALSSSSVDLELWVWCRDAGVAKGVRFDLLEAIKKRFDAMGIEIPFAYQNIVIKSGTGVASPKESE
ncbi:mechanosensitive ion channel family protein [Pistricoccus aurantiacus]|uniref:Small-conductance mechanosensitive channel n=1 Tax=Pistricoccus aurantiacus TaxID=1883414 RepID=A0A5B8SXI5_9GAMM|nr:mechanosensitive ion channel family protein [Pistricoccus aurantiacus]QEA39510.1 mechanosensitive ion channel family protein [Pistricoccus aurantiacus]